MPKNSSLTILKRWQAMDHALLQEGLNVPNFARKWKVCTKTVYRDLAAFRALGRRTKRTYLGEFRECWWAYASGINGVFTHLPEVK